MASPAAGQPWTASAEGLRLSVRLTPRGGRDAIDGVEILSDGRPVLKARVRATPSEGEANAALLALIARTLDLPRSAVTLAAGAGARLKTVAIAGDPAGLGARLEAITAPR
ncbi:MAG TPA: DUF167 family protein [Bosea sp. (in: a-proteobacteria)]|uniref:DUF167 family protein n=1 Tax=Bosea sp. (in: a-proteobacteria) TaxID=1871050 RepID=UPI002DDD6CA9|nr:DUF167 family protein [Bosea sp. (in: a-proteobacteria)]HEV2554327.1 DUF167 family protein [Bosea sp. (in: a-proteobacteria)]